MEHVLPETTGCTNDKPLALVESGSAFALPLTERAAAGDAEGDGAGQRATRNAQREIMKSLHRARRSLARVATAACHLTDD